MRIVFIGAVEFSRSALERVISLNLNVVGVCTLKKSDFNTDFVDLSVTSDNYNIPWIYAKDINSEVVVQWIKKKTPDVIYCFGWSRLLSPAVLNLAPLGVVGFHPAALPKNRGRHPLIWALVLGLERTASTFYFMDMSADSGDILSQQEVLITKDDDARVLYERVTAVAMMQIDEISTSLATRSFERKKQDDGIANTWRKRSKGDGQIDWRMSAKSIHNLISGLAKPYVGAHFVFKEQEIKVWRSAVVVDAPDNMEPGKVLMKAGANPIIKCGEDAICLLETEPDFEPIVGGYL